MNIADRINFEKSLPHKPGCMMLRGDIVCNCGTTQEYEYGVEDKLTLEDLREIHESDNAGGDCDCSYCREYRRRIKEGETE